MVNCQYFSHMFPSLKELFWAVAGNAVIGVGAGTATLAAFAPSLSVAGVSNPALRVGVVSVGFAIFFAGYHLTQAATYRDPDESLLEALVPGSSGTGGAEPQADAGGVDGVLVVRGVFVVLGVLGLGAGMRLFALTIDAWSGTLGVLTGVVCIGGYVCGHIGINGVPL